MDFQENNNGELLTIQRSHAQENTHQPEPEKKSNSAYSSDVPELSGRFRELRRFLERERASAESAIANKEYFLEQLRSNLRELEEISDELEELSNPGLRSPKERDMLIDKLCLRYYRTSGTIAGLGERESIAAVSTDTALPKSFGTLFHEYLPHLIGTIIGAVIIAAAIAAVFC